MRKGWSQQRLADACSMSKMNLSEIERGSVTLNINHMRLLARALGVDVSELLSDRDNPLRLEDDERELVERLRQADTSAREQLHKVAEVILPAPPDRRTGTI